LAGENPLSNYTAALFQPLERFPIRLTIS
jgi:hypothetical protein